MAYLLFIRGLIKAEPSKTTQTTDSAGDLSGHAADYAGQPIKEFAE